MLERGQAEVLHKAVLAHAAGLAGQSFHQAQLAEQPQHKVHLLGRRGQGGAQPCQGLVREHGQGRGHRERALAEGLIERRRLGRGLQLGRDGRPAAQLGRGGHQRMRQQVGPGAVLGVLGLERQQHAQAERAKGQRLGGRRLLQPVGLGQGFEQGLVRRQEVEHRPGRAELTGAIGKHQPGVLQLLQGRVELPGDLAVDRLEHLAQMHRADAEVGFQIRHKAGHQPRGARKAVPGRAQRRDVAERFGQAREYGLAPGAGEGHPAPLGQAAQLRQRQRLQRRGVGRGYIRPLRGERGDDALRIHARRQRHGRPAGDHPLQQAQVCVVVFVEEIFERHVQGRIAVEALKGVRRARPGQGQPGAVKAHALVGKGIAITLKLQLLAQELEHGR